MRLAGAPVSLFIVAAAACGSSGGTSPTDGGAALEGSTPAPDGGGVCCPIASDPCSACGGPSGGWAQTASQCSSTNGPCDGWIGKWTDAHGCAVIATGQNVPGAACCGCPPANDGGSSDGDAASTCPGAPPPIGGSCTAGLSCSYCDGGALCDCNAGQWECGGSTSCLPGGGGG